MLSWGQDGIGAGHQQEQQSPGVLQFWNAQEWAKIHSLGLVEFCQRI